MKGRLERLSIKKQGNRRNEGKLLEDVIASAKLYKYIYIIIVKPMNKGHLWDIEVSLFQRYSLLLEECNALCGEKASASSSIFRAI